MSWGYKILSVYVLFVAGIMFLVFKTSQEKVDLVTKDYYEQELKYQERIDQSARAASLSSGLSYQVGDGMVSIKFPSEMNGKSVEADVLLYCPSDKQKDISKKLETTNAEMVMPFPASYKGMFELKMHWKAEGSDYYSSHKFFIQ